MAGWLSVYLLNLAVSRQPAKGILGICWALGPSRPARTLTVLHKTVAVQF